MNLTKTQKIVNLLGEIVTLHIRILSYVNTIYVVESPKNDNERKENINFHTVLRK